MQFRLHKLPKIKQNISESLIKILDDEFKNSLTEFKKDSEDSEIIDMYDKIKQNINHIISKITLGGDTKANNSEQKLINVVKEEIKKISDQYETKMPGVDILTNEKLQQDKQILESKQNALMQFQTKLEVGIKGSIQIYQPSLINDEMKRTLNRFLDLSQKRQKSWCPIKPTFCGSYFIIVSSILGIISLIPSFYFINPVLNEWQKQKSLLDKIITPCGGNQTCGDYYVHHSYNSCDAPDAQEGGSSLAFRLASDCSHGILAICQAVCDLLGKMTSYYVAIVSSLIFGSVGLIALGFFLKCYSYPSKKEVNDTPIKHFFSSTKRAASDMFAVYSHTSFFKQEWDRYPQEKVDVPLSLKNQMGEVRKAAIRTDLKLFAYSISKKENEKKCESNRYIFS